MENAQISSAVNTFLKKAATPEFWTNAVMIAVTAILILVFFYILQAILRRGMKKNIADQKAQLILKIVRYAGWIIAVVSVLQSMGVNLSALLGAAGIAGIAIGFAAQTSISNLISGIFLIFEKPFQINDVIQIGDIVGNVMSIDLLSVKLQTFDNRFVRIPNENIIKTNVINISRFPIRRLDINVSISYVTDLKKATETLRDIAAKNLYALDNPQPLILIDKFDGSGINVLLGVWYEQSQFVDVKNTIIAEIQSRFAQDNIEISYPKRDVYIKSMVERN
jgi:small-conductance mechanosensitive channel